MAELGAKDVDYLIWYAVFAPKNTPPAILKRLSDELGRVAADPESVKKLDQLGVDTEYLNQDQLKTRVRTDVKNWGQATQGNEPDARIAHDGCATERWR